MGMKPPRLSPEMPADPLKRPAPGRPALNWKLILSVAGGIVLGAVVTALGWPFGVLGAVIIFWLALALTLVLVVPAVIGGLAGAGVHRLRYGRRLHRDRPPNVINPHLRIRVR